MKFVIDASVCIKWYIPEIYSQNALRLLKGGHIFHAPELLLPEVSNIVWKKVRRNHITAVDGRQVVEAIAVSSIILHSHSSIIKSAYLGAETSGQTVYDWTYLALAISLSCEFVTADQRFYKALENTPLKKNLLWIGDV
jgi:predicted nucleic acid-binding protein